MQISPLDITFGHYCRWIGMKHKCLRLMTGWQAVNVFVQKSIRFARSVLVIRACVRVDPKNVSLSHSLFFSVKPNSIYSMCFLICLSPWAGRSLQKPYGRGLVMMQCHRITDNSQQYPFISITTWLSVRERARQWTRTLIRQTHSSAWAHTQTHTNCLYYSWPLYGPIVGF